MFRIRILVISSCTSTKSISHPSQLTLRDFQNPEGLAARKAQLGSITPALTRTARELYTGRQHQYVVEAVDRLRAVLPGAAITLEIVSAGYGLVGEAECLLPYEATFNGMRSKEAIAFARDILHLPERIRQAVAAADLAIFLLGESYLKTLGLENWEPRPGLLFVAGSATAKWFPRQLMPSLVPFTNDDVKVIGGGQVGLKGAILKRLASKLSTAEQPGALLDALVQEPPGLREILELPPPVVQGLLPFLDERSRKPRPKPTIHVPSPDRAKNAGPRPRFFVPDWDDLVNPLYQFDTDTHAQPGGFNPLRHGVYAHELLRDPVPYDGILVSRSVMDDANDWKREHFQDAHQFLRFPNRQPIMGDCGAFSYLHEHEPPYTTEDVLSYYQRHGLDLGVSVDHLIVGPYAQDAGERERRQRLTIDNAQDFITQYKSGSFSFKPMGIAQGWDIPSYKEAVGNLLEMGYEHIAFGSLAFAKSQVVANLLAEVSPLFTERLYVHMFGLAREELLPTYALYGVTAFDSATFLRRSWMSAKDNYLDTTSGDWYTALRVPPLRFTVTTRHGVQERYHKVAKALQQKGTATYEQIGALEREALRALRAYGRREIGIEEALGSVLAYDDLMMPGKNLSELYTRTLRDRPWERCTCAICAELGVEVLIFRQNDRNRRRGFHNAHAFRQLEQRQWTLLHTL